MQSPEIISIRKRSFIKLKNKSKLSYMVRKQELRVFAPKKLSETLMLLKEISI